jgi:hypothetical protein
MNGSAFCSFASKTSADTTQDRWRGADRVRHARTIVHQGHLSKYLASRDHVFERVAVEFSSAEIVELTSSARCST